MGRANQRPPRSAPQLLVLPERDRIERTIRTFLAPDAVITALELERNYSLIAGEVLEMVLVLRFPPPDHSKRLTLRHVMPGGEPNMRELIGGAEVLGQTVRMRFRRYGGNWAPVMLSDG